MAKTISILGCGWLGTALGKSLLWRNYIVKGSTASAARYNVLETTGIGTFHIKVEPDSMTVDYTSFFNADVLVISIPPKRVENIEEIFPQQIQQIIQYIKKQNIKKVLFISSTSVYESTNRKVKEGEEGTPEKPSGRALLKAEKMLQEIPGVQTTILRFGGLIGADRNPARFLLRAKEVAGRSPVNLIHRDDCVQIITELIEKEVWGEIFNASSPGHPTKKDFYTKAAEVSQLPVPTFTERPENFKIVSSDKLIQRLNYSFKYPNPLDYLKELQEWAYRI